MNIQDFSPKNREKMVQRILESKQNKWRISDYDTKEKAEAKLKELKDIFAARADDMPSMWCENVDGHIKELENLLASGKLNESRKTYYWTCPDCGANLDPGERCDCKDEKKEQDKKEIVKNVIRESRLPKDNRDPQYGIPEQKKYPLFDKEHVESAIRLFGHVDVRFEEKLARAIIAKMKKYDIPFDMIGKDNKLYRYLPEPVKEKISLTESVLDPIHNTRPSEVFDGDTMKPEVREFILNLVNLFKTKSELDFEVKKVYMIGSSTGYQYSDISDIDINIEVDKPSEYFKGRFSLIPKGVCLPNTQRPVNVFLMFSPEETAHSVKYAENCYDLVANKFIKTSEFAKQEIPISYVSGLSSFLMNGIDVLIGEFERNKKDLMKIIRLNPNEVQISEKERDDALSRKITEIQTNADSLKLAHHFLFTFNNEGYQDSPFRVRINYKFDDPHYSMNSLIYKYVDSFGYFDKINAMEKEANELVKLAKKEIGKDFNNPTNEVEQKIEVQKEND